MYLESSYAKFTENGYHVNCVENFLIVIVMKVEGIVLKEAVLSRLCSVSVRSSALLHSLCMLI